MQRDIFEANVYVMSPMGRVIDLPNGATPLDFAYRIHTEVGHSTVGAMVNGYLVPLNTVLKTGDVVQIKTSKQSNGPNEGWLKIVKTAHARNKIRAFLLKKESEDRQQYVEKGETVLKEELKRRNLDEKELMEKTRLEAICGELRISNPQDLYYAIAVKSVSLQQVVERLANRKLSQSLDNEAIEKLYASKQPFKRTVTGLGVTVEGIDSMMVSFAKCCNPIYGDDIVGFITKGQGVKVHRKDCINVAAGQRLITVDWDEDAERKLYDVEILICATDRNFLISDIVTVVSQNKVALNGINSQTLDDRITVYIKLKLGVTGLENLRVLNANLLKINSSVSVERIAQ